MSKMVLKDAFLSVGGTDLSAFVSQLTLNYAADVPEVTSMGDTTRTRLAGGLKDWSVDVEFYQDFDASQLDDTLFALVGTQVALVIRPASAAVGSNNPEFTGNAILESYPPMGQSVGDAAAASATFQGDGTLTRATS